MLFIVLKLKNIYSFHVIDFFIEGFYLKQNNQIQLKLCKTDRKA